MNNRQQIQDEKTVFTITYGMVQHIAESNFDKKLSKKEIENVALALIEDSEVMDARDELIMDAIRKTL